jgi:TrmH family RNA methyltransferase
MLHITSRKNSKIRQIRALARRKERKAQGLFVVEGIRHVGEAVETETPLEYVLYSPDLLTSNFALALIEELERKGERCYSTTGDIFSELSFKENPQGILAVVGWQERRLDSLSPANFELGVAMVSPQDPGNVGTVLRTIDAVGADGLLLIDESVDPTHPTAVRASMGALFHLAVVQVPFSEFSIWSHTQGYHVYGSSAHGSTDYREVAYLHPAILLLGSEREGLRNEHKGVCEKMICLPMRGQTTSLNLSVAAGVLLYEMIR